MISSLKRVVIYGAGMMGASLAHALRHHAQFSGEIIAVVRSDRSAAALREKGLADTILVDVDPTTLAQYNPDFVVLGTPVLSLVQMLPLLKLDCPVTDMGSTRLAIERAARGTSLRFAGSHPMCGSENSGPEALVPDLFVNRLCIIINGIEEAVVDRDADLLDSIETFWKELGMHTFRLDATTHDRIVAGLSHGPHFLSSALAMTYLSDPLLLAKNEESPCAITGGGLRDMLRIAGSNPVMWRDILATNQRPIVDFLKSFRNELDTLIQNAERSDTDWVLTYQDRAHEVRDRIYGNARMGNGSSANLIPATHEASSSLVVGSENAKPRILSLDGPAGSGKSTVAGIIARRLGCLHADSGAIYRSLTYACMQLLGEQASPEEFGRVFLEQTPDPHGFALRVDYDNGKQLHYLNEEELGLKIRTPSVTARIRYIADHAQYRNRVNELLRELGAKTALIVDGRDIGTVVFPDTPFKFYLDAAVRTRAERRRKELIESGMEAPSLEELEKQIADRDEQDRNRKIGALQIPPGAILIDTSNIDRDMVVSGILAHLQEQF
jgi:prephenate dehydrogenase